MEKPFLYRNGKCHLAPHYDLVATINYESVSTGMAMSIGGEETIHNVSGPHWTAEAKAMGISPKMRYNQVNEISEQIVSGIGSVFANIDPISEGFRRRLSLLIARQCKRIQKLS